jgi:uncharacterized membrane protein
MDERIIDFITTHRGKIIGGLIGLILGLMVFSIGFFQTLLILGFVALGVYFGSRRENWDRFVRYLARLFPDNRG